MATETPEVRAIANHSAALTMIFSGNPELIAGILVSTNFIQDDVLLKLSGCDSPIGKATVLVKAVKKEIEKAPERFYDFLMILAENTKNIVDDFRYLPNYLRFWQFLSYSLELLYTAQPGRPIPQSPALTGFWQFMSHSVELFCTAQPGQPIPQAPVLDETEALLFTVDNKTLTEDDWNVVSVECGSLAAKWEQLSACLGLAKSKIDMIRESRPRDIAGCWSEALSQWIKQNYSTQRFGLPSWRSLLKAVAMVDRRLCKELAAKHSSEMLQVPFAVVQPPASPENRQSRELSSSLQVAPTSKRHDQLQPLSQVDMEMIRSNEEEIRALFSSLLLSVQKALVAQSVNVSDVHQFLVNFFQQSECFHSLSTFGEIFIATTVHRLWDYQHYSPLELLTKQFLPTNQPIATSITEYKANLTGFFLVTKLVDYIKYKGLEAGDGPQQPLAMMKLTPQQYRKIKVVLDLNRKVSELSLEYVQNLWFSFADEYELPCLTAVIDKIVTGSLEVSWLVLSHLIARIKPRSRFFRRHQIILVFIDDVILYDEKTMPGYEKQLLLLCAEGRADLSQFSDILNRGVDPDIHNQSGHHPLLYAVFHKRADLVHLLLENKANVNLTTINDNFAESALIQACHGGHEESAAILIKNSADVNYMDKNGRSPLWKASYHGYSSIVLLLLQHNAQVDLPTNNEHGETALFAASAKGHLRTATILLQYGAVVNYTNKLGNTPLFFASKEGHDELMDLLLAHGAEVNKGSQPPLFGASEFDRVHIVRHLIQRGADVNLTTSGDDFASSPLGKACNANQLQVVKVLIENGAMINYRNKAGWTGLLDVTEHGREEIVQYLLHSNADTEVQNQEGRTALLIACWRGFLSIVVILIKFGANTNAQDREGLSGLMLATEKDESAIVEALLDAKADPNITDKNTGWSALFFASKNGNIKIIQLLIASGAQVNLLDKNGLTAYDIAESNGHHHVSEELKQHTIQEAKTEITEDQQKQVKKSYQRLSRIFDVLEETLLRGRKEKRLYQTVHKGVSSNITQANQQTDNDNF